MISWIHHWIIQDFYNPVWPNLAASGICALTVLKRMKSHLAKHRKWQARHFAALHTKVNAIHSQVNASPSGETTRGN